MFELAGVLILGVLSQYFAWKFKIPAILPLIMTGLIVGPISAEYFSSDGTKWIEPIWNGTEGLLPEQILFHFISLSIGLILFEGGLTLKFSELKKNGASDCKVDHIGGNNYFYWSSYTYSLYTWYQLGNIIPFFCTGHSNRSYSHFSNSTKYSTKEKCFYSIKVGKHLDRSYWSFGGRIGI